MQRGIVVSGIAGGERSVQRGIVVSSWRTPPAYGHVACIARTVLHTLPSPPPSPTTRAHSQNSKRCPHHRVAQGMITPDMLTDEEYPDVVEDIKSECERSGPVADIKIPREGEHKVPSHM